MRRLLSIIGATLGIIAGATQTTLHPPTAVPSGAHVQMLDARSPQTAIR